MLLLEKAESCAGSGLLRSTSSVSPTAQRRDCLNLALCLVLSYVQMADETLRDEFLLGWAFWLVAASILKWPKSFHMTSYMFPFKNKWKKTKLLLILINSPYCLSSLHKVREMCSGLFHRNSAVSCSRWPSGPHEKWFHLQSNQDHTYQVIKSTLTCHWSCVVSLNIPWMFPYAFCLKSHWFFCLLLTNDVLIYLV